MANEHGGPGEAGAGGPSGAPGADRFLDRHRWSVFGVLVLAAVVLAWLHRFVCDDAFITFNYARSLVEGSGLTWFGTRVEGYSNFLWVLWSALGIRLGVDPVLWSWLVGVACFVATVLATWRLGLRLLSGPLAALLAPLLLLTNFTVLSFATSGLETMLQTALVSLGLLAFVRSAGDGPVGLRPLLGLSLAAGLAVLTRMDSALPFGIIGIWAIVLLARRGAGARHYVALVLPALVLVLPWLAWKQAYYGTVLPNSFSVKVGLDPAAFRVGLRYLGRFLSWYLFWPVLLLGAVALAVRRRRICARLLPLAIVVLAWFGYAVLVGGDFMEFRFLVPAVPAFFLLLAFLVAQGLDGLFRRGRTVLPVLALVVLVAASAVHARRFQSMSPDQTLDSIDALAEFYTVIPDRNWARLGTRLRSDLEGTGAVLALDAVGAIPFYSRLETVDLLGLNEPHAERRFRAWNADSPRPGHRLRAPLAYLREKRVNLVLGHPTPVELGTLGQARDLSSYASWIMNCADLTDGGFDGPVLVVMPFAPGAGLLMWYLAPTPRIDSAMARNGWETRMLPVRLRPERVARQGPAGRGTHSASSIR